MNANFAKSVALRVNFDAVRGVFLDGEPPVMGRGEEGPLRAT